MRELPNNKQANLMILLVAKILMVSLTCYFKLVEMINKKKVVDVLKKERMYRW